MYYSLDDLRLGARFKSDEYQTQRIQNDELDQYINEGIDQAQSIIWPLNEGYFVKQTYTNLVAMQDAYELPHDSKSIIGIDYSTDGGSNYNILRERNIDNRNLNDATTNLSGYSGFYFRGNSIVLVQKPTVASTNGIKFIYIWEHWDLDDNTNFTTAVSSATRLANIISVTCSAAHNVENGQLVTLSGMLDNTFDGTFRVESVPTTQTLTLYQDGQPDDATAGNTGSLLRRYGMDLPGGKTVKRYVEAWATRMVMQRDDKPVDKVDAELAMLDSQIKHNLNYRNRGKTKKIRMKNIYSTALINPYDKRRFGYSGRVG